MQQGNTHGVFDDSGMDSNPNPNDSSYSHATGPGMDFNPNELDLNDYMDGYVEGEDDGDSSSGHHETDYFEYELARALDENLDDDAEEGRRRRLGSGDNCKKITRTGCWPGDWENTGNVCYSSPVWKKGSQYMHKFTLMWYGRTYEWISIFNGWYGCSRTNSYSGMQGFVASERFEHPQGQPHGIFESTTRRTVIDLS